MRGLLREKNTVEIRKLQQEKNSTIPPKIFREINIHFTLQTEKISSNQLFLSTDELYSTLI